MRCFSGGSRRERVLSVGHHIAVGHRLSLFLLRRVIFLQMDDLSASLNKISRARGRLSHSRGRFSRRYSSAHSALRCTIRLSFAHKRSARADRGPSFAEVGEKGSREKERKERRKKENDSSLSQRARSVDTFRW